MERLRRRGTLWVLLWLTLMLGLLFPYFEQIRNANERPRLLQGIAIVEDGSWAIDGPSVRDLDPGPDVSRSEADGHVYPNKPPGTSLLAAVGYRIGRALADADDPLDLRTYTWWARILAGLVPTVLLCGVLLRRYAVTFGRGAAAGAVTLYALGTPAAAYAHLLYGHQLAAALLGVGILWLLDAGRPDTERRLAIGRALGGGVAAGAAVGVEYGAVFAALPIAGLLLSRGRTPQGRVVLGAGLAGALLPVALLAGYHQAVYGSPWSTGYHHVTVAEFAAKHGQGLLGLGLPSFDAFTTHVLAVDTGLLWWAPTVVLALYGLVQLARSRDPEEPRTEGRVMLALLLVYVLVVSSLSFEGGWRIGPRYLVVALPALVVGWAHVLSQARTSWPAMAVVMALGTYALVVNALAANLWPHIDPTNVEHPVSEVLLPLWEHDREPYGVIRSLTGRSGLRLVVVGSVLGGWLVLLRAAETAVRMAAAMALGAALGLLLVPSSKLWTPHPKGARNLAYIERVWEPTSRGDGSSIVLVPRADATSGGRDPAAGRRGGESSRSRRRPRARARVHRGDRQPSRQ